MYNTLKTFFKPKICILVTIFFQRSNSCVNKPNQNDPVDKKHPVDMQ